MIRDFAGVWPFDRKWHAVLTPMRRGLTWIMRPKPQEARRRRAWLKRKARVVHHYPADPKTKIMRAVAHERGWTWR